ncbi:amino acid permease [Vagococcus bubulae]|uniref:Amino acid permease n=1 Tax=Vagococcus bubulae TaxID=1977868 RepID=A0A429ZA30_9ENTE|nr:amino acid permease [Vagococcus bubulae]RST90526.1 amino acid permease [Vagococcus bubulae]
MENKSGSKASAASSVKPVATNAQGNNTASKKGALSKITLATFIGLTFSLVAGPYYSTLTATGWNMFLFMGIAVIGFALPIALISGEFGTTFPGQGGPELWVKNTLGPKWGFVTSWLIWAAMFPSMVVVGTGFAPMVALLLKKESLIENSMFTLAVILGLVWCMTLLNLKFDMAKVNGKFGIWLGLYIPVVMLFILGVFTFVKIGLNPDSILGTFSWSKLVPKSFTSGSGMYFSGIIFIFLGIEMSSVFITRLKKPSQQYAKGVITSLILLALFSLVNSFLVANVIPAGKIQLNNGAQPLQLFADRLGLPYFVVQIFCLLSIVSVLTNMSTWFISAQKTITASAREGDFPEKFKFWKTNKFNSSNTLLFVQAIAITILSGAYVIIPGINKVFVIITNSGTMIYCLAYTLMALGFISMRRKSPDTEHPFRVGKKGNGFGFFFAGLLIVTIVFALTLTFMSNTIENLIFVLIFVGILFSIPLIIYKKKKDSWLIDVQKEMAKDTTQTTNK